MIATFLGRVASPTVGLLQDMEFVTRADRRRDADNDGISAAEMLRKFCEWQSSVNFLDDSSPYHHDTALLLTRYSSEQHTLRAYEQLCGASPASVSGSVYANSIHCWLLRRVMLTCFGTFPRTIVVRRIGRPNIRE